LEIEKHLLSRPNIMDVAVVGVEDPQWGQRVAAVAVPKDKNSILDLKSIKDWASSRMAPYKIPTLLRVYKDGLPRNVMGKVNKKELVKAIFLCLLEPLISLDTRFEF